MTNEIAIAAPIAPVKRPNNKALIQELLRANADKPYSEILAIVSASAIPNPPKVNDGQTTREQFIKSTIAWGVRIIQESEPNFTIAAAPRMAKPKVASNTVKVPVVKNSGPIKAKNGSLAVKPKSEGLTVEEIADRNARRLAVLKDVGQRYSAKTEKLEAEIKGESATAAA